MSKQNMDDWGGFDDVPEYPTAPQHLIKQARLEAMLDEPVRLPDKKGKKKKPAQQPVQEVVTSEPEPPPASAGAKHHTAEAVPDLSMFALPSSNGPRVRFAEPDAAGPSAATLPQAGGPQAKKAAATAAPAAAVTSSGPQATQKQGIETAGNAAKRKQAGEADGLEPGKLTKKQRKAQAALAAGHKPLDNAAVPLQQEHALAPAVSDKKAENKKRAAGQVAALASEPAVLNGHVATAGHNEPDSKQPEQQQQQQQQQQRHESKDLSKQLSPAPKQRQPKQLKEQQQQQQQQQEGEDVGQQGEGQQNQQGHNQKRAKQSQQEQDDGGQQHLTKKQRRAAAAGAQQLDVTGAKQSVGPTAKQPAAAGTGIKQPAAGTAAKQPAAGTAAKAGSGGSGLLDKMRAQLAGGRFRSLNEELYTCDGDAAYKMMQSDPSLFDHYHSGFQQQTAGWPQQPLELAAAWLAPRPADLVVVDFGCGEGRLATIVKQKVHSFDLVSAAPHVVACNMAHVPLETGCADVAVFSLALMGTDYGAFLIEAARVLRHKGWLWIAEVRSRFAGDDPAGQGSGSGANKSNKAQDLQPFLRCMGKLGFNVASLDTSSNTMFFVAVLRKVNVADGDTAKIKWPALKACVYKKR